MFNSALDPFVVMDEVEEFYPPAPPPLFPLSHPEREFEYTTMVPERVILPISVGSVCARRNDRDMLFVRKQ